MSNPAFPYYVLVAPDGRFAPSKHKESSLRAAAKFADNRLYEVAVAQMKELGSQPKESLMVWCEANTKRIPVDVPGKVA